MRYVITVSSNRARPISYNTEKYVSAAWCYGPPNLIWLSFAKAQVLFDGNGSWYNELKLFFFQTSQTFSIGGFHLSIKMINQA